MAEKITGIRQFYGLMKNIKEIRQDIVKSYINQNESDRASIAVLEDILDSLEGINRKGDRYVLSLYQDKTMELNLDYEIGELKKDIFFLTHREDEFYQFLSEMHVDFYRQLKEGEKFLNEIQFLNFFTDRDGTVNNYCGRYLSSVQSIYNAVFLIRFAACVENSIILTSAPLEKQGLIDISVTPPGIFIYAGSKGREFYDTKGTRRRFPIEKNKQDKLDELNHYLSELVKKPEYEMFLYIGSGLQFKFGQTTIARQDIDASVPEDKSVQFLKKTEDMVKKLDPGNRFFRIEDTGKDIEIILTVESRPDGEPKNKKSFAPYLKDYDKGNGIQYLNTELALNMEKGPNLICGDTFSDIPMVKASQGSVISYPPGRKNNTWSIFVTDDNKLKKDVSDTCPHSFFVNQPDILVSILNNLGLQRQGETI